MINFSEFDKADWAIFISIAIPLVAVLVNYWNVSRQREANQKNDEKKFRRDLNLKSSDEFIELLFSSHQSLCMIRTLDQVFIFNIGSNSNEIYKMFNDELWKIISNWNQLLHDIKSYYLKREIILSSFKSDLDALEIQGEKVHKLTWELKSPLWKIIQHNIFEISHAEIIDKIEEIKREAELVIRINEKLIKEVQFHFLGELYKKSKLKKIFLFSKNTDSK